MCRDDDRPIAFSQSAVEPAEYGLPIDLNRELVPHPAYTYLVRVQGDAMGGYGLWDGDIVVVDRSVRVRVNSLVVAIRNESFAIRCVVDAGASLALAYGNGQIDLHLARAEVGTVIWGVITYSIHRHAGAGVCKGLQE